MKLLGILVLAFLSNVSVAQQGLLIRNVTLISPELPGVKMNRHVHIIDDRIVDNNVKTPNNQNYATVIDGRGKFLVPGIMDSHAHVSSIPGLGFGGEAHVQKNNLLAKEYFKQQPKSFLYHGVTHIVDPNPGQNWRDFIANDSHPDYFRCEVITSRTTFPYIEKPLQIAKKLFPYVVNEHVSASDEHSPEQLVKKIAQSGAICIKLYFEDGYGDNNQWPLLSDKTLKRIRNAANEHHLLILAHANAVDMYRVAIDIDVDVIAHGLWNWGPYRQHAQLPAQMKVMLDEIIEKDIGVMATQRVIAGLGEVMLPDIKDSVAFQKTTPRRLLNWYKTTEAQWFQKELIAGFDGLPAATIAEIFIYGRVPKGQQVLRYLHQQQANMILASDFPGSPSYANQPGLTTYQEMQMLEASGVSLQNVLAAATINNAKQFNLSEQYGTIENGKIANLLLLNKNPLKTITAWDSIEKIILRGVVHERNALKANQ